MTEWIQQLTVPSAQPHTASQDFQQPQ